MEPENDNINEKKANEPFQRANNEDSSKKSDPKQKNKPLEPSELMADVDKANKDTNDKQDRADIPRFNIASKIAPRIRRATASKRIAPSAQKSQKAEAIKSNRINIADTYSKPRFNPIIAEIVARDIQKLRRANGLANNNC